MQHELYRKSDAGRYRCPTHVSLIVDDVTKAILDNVVMNNGQPPTLEEAMTLKRRWVDINPDDGEAAV